MRICWLLLLALLLDVPEYAQNVLTQHNDNSRSGANLQETHVTPASVRAGFGKLFSRPVDGQIYAQPLIVNGVNIPGKGLRNVVYVATMKNNVYAFDADDPAEDCWFWRKNLGQPVPYQLIPLNWGSLFLQYNIKPFIGITSTPVIDVGKGRMWVSVKTMVAPDDLRYYLYSLDITNGNVITQSKPIESGDGVDKLTGMTALQRPGLLLSKGMVYLAFGSQQDGGFYHGWVVAFDPDTLEQKHVFCATCGNILGEGGIWQAGNGPAADANGNIYVMTGNGSFEPDKQYGTSFIKLSPELKVVDWFTPSNHLFLSLEDVDLGSSGPVLLPGGSVAGGGKQGRMYLLNGSAMGKLQPGHSTAPALQEFKVSSHWSLNWLSWLLPVFGYHHIHGAPIYWESDQKGILVYVWPEESLLRAYKFSPSTYFDIKHPINGPTAPKGMPGGFLSISSNGKKDGLLWATSPLNEDAFVNVVRGVFRVFDANTLEQLWSTDTATPDDVFNFAKYCPPTVANGKVYLATFSDALYVYGNTPPVPGRPLWTTTGKKPNKSSGHGRMNHGHTSHEHKM
jgi:outer membrane protein assembly factor BamB